MNTVHKGLDMKQTRDLSKNIIIQQALLILEEFGLEKLSIRILAQKLRVVPSALYNHFAGKQELIIALQAYYLHPDNKKYQIDYTTKTWQDFLQSIATSSRSEFLERNYLLDLFATHSSESEQSIINFEKYMSVMTEFGFSLLYAGQISHTIYTYIVGFCNFENNVKKNNTNTFVKYTQSSEIQQHALVDKFLHKHGWDFDRDYQFGIETLISGFSKYCHANN